MRKIPRLMLAIPFFTLLGNAQDDAAPASLPMGYAAQGNVEMNQVLRETEMQRAVQTARERKALKEAMAGYVRKPSDITTAEQFLSVNRPPGLPPREGDTEIPPVKRSSYVPEFQTTASRSNPSSAPGESVPMVETAAATPPPEENKRGLFSFLRFGQNRAEETTNRAEETTPGLGFLSPAVPAPPPSDYPAPIAPVVPVALASPVEDAAAVTGDGQAVPIVSGERVEEIAADRVEAIPAATVSPGSSGEEPGFFHRFFGKGKKGVAR